MPMVFALYDGYVVRESDKAVGFGETPDAKKLLWIPKSVLHNITYQAKGVGDSTRVRIGEAIEAIQIPDWLARQEKLEIDK